MLTGFRKLAIHTWHTPTYPGIYTRLTLDYTPWRSYLQRHYPRTGITVTHVIAHIFGQLLHAHPQLNRRIRWGRLEQRQHVRVFMPVHLRTRSGYDLSGITIVCPPDTPLPALSQAIRQSVSDLKTNPQHALHKTYALIRFLPVLITRPLLRSIAFITETLRWSLPYCPTDPFGSIIISSLGTLGLSDAYIPLYPLARQALLIAVGRPYETDAGQWRVTLSLTLDHRYVDGADLVRPLAHLKRLMAYPDARVAPA